MLDTKQKLILGVLITLASLFWLTYWYLQQSRPLLKNSLDSELSDSARLNFDRSTNKSDAEIFADIKNKFTINNYSAQLNEQKRLLQTTYKQSDLVERILIDRELTLLTIKIEMHDTLYPDKVALLVEVYQYLNKVGVTLPDKATDFAKAALLRGNFTPAYDLIAPIEFYQSSRFEPELVLRAASAANVRGRISENQINYRKAYRHYRRAVSFIPNNIGYLLAAGRIASKIALYNNAINFYESALPLLRQKQLKQKPLNQEKFNKNNNIKHKRRQIWVDLGIAWNSKGNAGRAIKYFNLALDSDLQLWGANHANVASDKNRLGWAWETKGNFKKAIGFYRQAYRLNQSNLGAAHATTIRVKENLDAAIHLFDTSEASVSVK